MADKGLTVVLLTKDGGPLIKEMLDALFRQPGGFEVIAVDSGSTDGTLELLRSYPVRLYQIPPEEFNHGLTRNFGASKASPGSRYIAFLTQDAVPMPGWLPGLLRPMEDDPEVAGVFSRQLPRGGGNPILRRYMLEEWGQCGGPDRVEKKLTDRADYERRKKWYITFNDPSSAVRREVFEKIPFRRADFAEDLMWARDVLEAGYKLVYEPASTVVHSHEYSLTEQFRQHFDDAGALAGLTGAGSGKGRPLGRLFGKLVKDAAYLLRQDMPLHKRLGWLLYMPFWHLAVLSGTVLGLKRGALPDWLVRLCSRQSRIKRGLYKTRHK